MYVLDSCICIDFLRGKLPGALRIMRQSDPRLFAIPAIVEAELHVGADNSRDPQRSRRIVDEFLIPFKILPFDSTCARIYGNARAYLEKQGLAIGGNDLLIAATCLAHGATLATHNVRELKRVPGLSIEDWDEIEI